MPRAPVDGPAQKRLGPDQRADPVAVQCLDNKGYTDYGFTEAVITPVDSADDVSEDVSEGETGAVTTESDAAATRTPRQFAVAGAAALAAALA